MNLPDFAQEEAFKNQRERMGAKLRPWSPTVEGWRDIDEELQGHGIEIDLGNIEIQGDGTFVHQGRRVAVYIRDQYQSSESAAEPTKLCKVHVAECDKLKQMQDKGKYDVRYVATTRTDGLFVVNFSGQFGSGGTAKGIVCRLFVCIYCLRQLDYKNFNACTTAKRKNIKESFNLSEFFERYGSHITNPPPHTDITAPPNDYTPDWPDVSLRFREQANWQCSNCDDDLTDENKRRFLHVHHINGVKSDNREQNLQVLCIVCHAEIDRLLLNSLDYAEYVQIKRETG